MAKLFIGDDLSVFTKLKKLFLPRNFSIDLTSGFDQKYYTLADHTDLASYISVQVGKTSEKLGRGWRGAWTTKDSMERVAAEVKYINSDQPIRAVCHGVRTGQEVLWLREALPDGQSGSIRWRRGRN